MNRRSLIHLREAFLPLAGLIACLAGRAESAAGLLGAFLLVRLCSLCADGAYLRAAADELSAKNLARFRRTAGLMLVLGMIVSGVVLYLFVPVMQTIPFAHAACFWGAALWMMSCRFSAAYMTADGEEASATLCEFLLAILLLTCIFLGDAGYRFGEKVAGSAMFADVRWDAPALCVCAAALMTLLSALAADKIAPAARGCGWLPAGKMFARAPMALLRGLFCPVLMAACVFFAGAELLPAALAGWALAAAGLSLYRRSEEETAPFMAVFVPVSAALIFAAAALPENVPLEAVKALAEAGIFGIPAAPATIALAAAATVLLNAHISVKSVLCAVIVLAAGIAPCKGVIWAAAGAGIAALGSVLFLRDATLSLRAARTRRKYQRI